MSEPTEADWLEARDSWRERYGHEAEDPQLEEVRGWYIDGRRVHNPFASDAVLVERFDRWLADYTAEVVREAEARALEEVADQWRYHWGSNGEETELWLRARAAEIREKGQSE